jgi:hypothetical protein
MPSIVTREYNPTNGAFIGNVSSLSFGSVPVGTHSPVKVIDLAFVGVASVSNIRLGLLNSGQLKVTDAPCDAPNSDGSCSNGYFGIMHTNSFDQSVAQGGCLTHFRDAYASGVTPDNSVSIGLRDTDGKISQYIYLDIQLGDSDVGFGGGTYRVFFDYA